MTERRVRIKLVIMSGNCKGREFYLEEGSNLIGRWDPETKSYPEIDLEEADVEAKISRKHAEIMKRGSQISIKDLSSLNGTTLNRDKRLPPEVEQSLQVGDEIIVGKVVLTLQKGVSES